MIVAGIVFGVGLGGTVLAAAALNQSWQWRQRRVLDAVAERLGGTVRREGILTGWALVLHRPGLGRVCLHHRVDRSDAPDRSMRLEIEIPRLLPSLRVVPAAGHGVRRVGALARPFTTGHLSFDQRFEAALEGPPTAEALVDATLGALIMGLWEAGGEVDVELALRPSLDHGLTVASIGHTGWLLDPDTLAAFLERGIAFAESLMRRWDLPWLALAGHLGLEPAPAEPKLIRGLQGHVEGHRVEIFEVMGHPMHRTLISVAVDSIPGLRIVLQDRAEDEGWLRHRHLTTNPVLDMLVAVRSEPPWQPLLQALMAEDTVTELLLSVVHGHPGSLVTHQRVVLLVPGAPQESLGALVAQALALARALRSGMGHHGGLAPRGHAAQPVEGGDE